jgi:hypothetical protein
LPSSLVGKGDKLISKREPQRETKREGLTRKSELSGAMLANVEALADNESDNNGVEEITQRDAGRETFYYDGQINNCRKLEITCKGIGTLQCLSYSVVYDDCYTI